VTSKNKHCFILLAQKYSKLGCAGLKRKFLLLKDVLVRWNKKNKFAVLIILLGSPYLFWSNFCLVNGKT